MRFLILFIALALLPMMTILHGWLFTESQLPELQREALARLEKNGIRGAEADLRFLDLRLAGNAPDLVSLEKAREAVAALKPIRVVKDELGITAALESRLEGKILTLKGWLPNASNIQAIHQLVGKLRPDLTVQTEALKAHPKVRWSMSEKGPMTADNGLLKPVLEQLRVSTWLKIQRDEKGIHISGLLPANGMRSVLLSQFNPAESNELLESTYTLVPSFAEPDVLMPFIQSFFAHSSKRLFSIHQQGEIVIEADATSTLEKEWLALLRPISGGRKVSSKLTLYPSPFHFPSYRPTTPLDEAQLEALRDALSGQRITFSQGNYSLEATEQAKLAALTPVLLTAGPALRLVIGGHPDPEGSPETEKPLALSRAEQVLSFLIEQGLPSTDVKALAFDPAPTGTPGAPTQINTVEILLR